MAKNFRPLNRRERIIVFLWRAYPIAQPLERLKQDDCGGPAARLRVWEVNAKRPNSILEPKYRMYQLNLPHRKHF